MDEDKQPSFGVAVCISGPATSWKTALVVLRAVSVSPVLCSVCHPASVAVRAPEGDLQKTVGRNLRAYRLERGLSQEDFADVLGVHRTYMGGVERGERNLTLRSVERIAERLEIDPQSLLAVRP